MMIKHFVICLFGIQTFIFAVNSTVIQMRIVKDTAIYGYAGGNLADSEAAHQLKATVPPSNFSGPILLKKIAEKCFNLTQERYRYIFCPFQNVTQYEVSARWNAYQGILGVWSHWEVENNTFSQIVFKHGDQCGDINRSIKIKLQCGPKEELLNVTEPNRCHYSATFSTRYACSEDALLVYPRLNENLRGQWDYLYTQYVSGDLTSKGYNMGLQKIFLEAGYSESPVAHPKAAHPEREKFMDLLACNKEYKKLSEEISKLHMEVDTLKLLINQQKLSNRTTM